MAIGDSLTQGYNVESVNAWPYQLGRSLNKSVYNYGVGGYGIFQYLHLANEAIRHEPEYVLLGLYPANDIDSATCSSVSPSYYQELLDSGITYAECKRKSQATLAQYSALLSVLEHLRFKYLWPIIAQNFFIEKYFDLGGILIKKNRVLKHNKMTDLSWEGVNGNYEASKIIFSLILNKLHSKGIKFGVIIIPSKELVVERWTVNSDVDIPSNFSIKPQINLIEKYITFFNKSSIPAIDATPFVVEAFTKSVELNEEFYPFEDGHPFAEGYESYGKAAARLISLINRNGSKPAEKSSLK